MRTRSRWRGGQRGVLAAATDTEAQGHPPPVWVGQTAGRPGQDPAVAPLSRAIPLGGGFRARGLERGRERASPEREASGLKEVSEQRRAKAAMVVLAQI